MIGSTVRARPEPTPAVDRVLDRVVVHPLGCWLYAGARTDRGYGVVQLGRGIGTAKAHRVVYEAEVGPIPAGLTLDHLCRTPACVNPAHLQPVTRAENTRRQLAHGHPRAGMRPEACKRGHLFTPENTRTDARGSRHCRACARARSAARRAARKDTP